MEIDNVEVAAVKDAIGEATEAQLRELTELQLAFIGGGIGDTAI